MRLLDDPRDQIKPVLRVRRVALEKLPCDNLRDHVGTQSLDHRQRMRHRFHTHGIHLAQLIHEAENPGQLLDVFGRFGLAHGQPRQMRNVIDFTPGQCH